MKQIFLILFLSSLFLQISAQDRIIQTHEQKYRYSKIVLKAGVTKRPKNININENEITYLMYNSQAQLKELDTINFNQIESIKVANKTRVWAGAMIGLGVGILNSNFIFNSVKRTEITSIDPRGNEAWYEEISRLQESTVYTYDAGGIRTEQKEYKVDYSIKTAPLWLAIGGGVVAGTVTGYLIKKGWKTISPGGNFLLR